MCPMTARPQISPELIARADSALVRTVDALSDEDLAAPSLLGGWTRAHVVAHLVLNGEGLERIVSGLRNEAMPTMYDSDEARDADIDELAGADPGELRERLLGATNRFERALGTLVETDRHVRFERTPGGREISVGSLPLMRLREVEIHNCDLDAGYGPTDWSESFAVILVDSMATKAYAAPFRLLARDLARTWQLGGSEGGPVVCGDAATLGWWLTGRGTGEGLSSDGGDLPRIEAW